MQLLMQQVQEQQQPREEQTSLMMRQLALQQQQQQEIHHRFQMKQQHSQPPMQQERQQLDTSIATSFMHDAESSPNGFDRAATIHPSTPPAPLPASPLQVFSPPSAGLASGVGGSVRVTSPLSPVSVSPRLYAPTHPPFPSPVMSLLPSVAPSPPKALYL